MLSATFLATFLIPLFYVIVASRAKTPTHIDDTPADGEAPVAPSQPQAH